MGAANPEVPEIAAEAFGLRVWEFAALLWRRK
jgi:hypothetical protein